MKKKKSTYFLVLAVIIIWIVILFRFTSFQGDDSGKPVMTKAENSFLVEKRVKEKLNLSYRDPFSRKIIKQEDVKANLIKNAIQNKKTHWPNIMYRGFITNKKTGAISINLTIGDKSFIARINQTVEKVRIKKITEESIEIEYQGEQKVIHLNK